MSAPSPAPGGSAKQKQKKKQAQAHKQKQSAAAQRDSAFADADDFVVVNEAPGGGSSKAAGSGGSKASGLTPTQRKAMHKASKRPQRKAASVEVEDASDSGDELINEEDDARSDLDEGSDSDSDGEADWEKDPPKPKSSPAAAASSSSPSSSSWLPSLRSLLLWSLALLVVGGLVWIRLQDAALWEGIDPDDVIATPPSEQEDYYNVLQVDRGAQLKDIKKSYRTLVLKVHPDKNPGCTDCAMQFQRVQKAYDVLSNSEKRQMYDSIETSFDVLRSDTTELTSDNFADLVLQGDGVWVLQVYTDWHRSAIRFAGAWEEAAARYGKLLHFGRIHAQRQRELLKTLPVKFGVIPTVLLYGDGKFAASKTFLESSHAALGKLAAFLAQHYPDTVQPVDNSKQAIQAFMRPPSGVAEAEQATVLFIPDFIKQAKQNRPPPPPRSGSHSARFQAQMLQSSQRRLDEPSLVYKAIARQFQHGVRFGQVRHIQDPQLWKHWIREVSQQFKLTPPTQLPALLYTDGSGDNAPKWLTGNLNKDKLLRHMDLLHRRLVPWLNSQSFARHCVDVTDARKRCVLALACQPPKLPELEFHSFASGARALLKQQAFKNAILQFGKVDVAKQHDMKPLCEALPEEVQKSQELSIVVIGDRGRTLHHYVASAHRSLQFDAWLSRVLKDEGSVESTDAPRVPVLHVPDDVLPVHIAPLNTTVYVPLKWLYSGLIIVGLIVFFPIISKHFASFVWLVFAASVLVPGLELAKDVFDKYFA